MRPPISYYGGKQKMVRHILPLIPHHNTYVEPFTGGGAVFFAKEPSPAEVINDLNDNLVNFYRVLSDEHTAEKLIYQLNATCYSHSEYKRACRIYKKQEAADPIKRAWAAYIACNWSFGKKPCGGWSTSMITSERFPKEHQAKLTTLSKARERLSTTYIECIDAIDLIKKWDSPNTFFYCDPPYPETDQQAYSDNYSVADFHNLVDVLKNIQGSFILSCYPMDGMPEDWEKIEINTKASAMGGKLIASGKKTERIECLWLGGNYTSAQQKLF